MNHPPVYSYQLITSQMSQPPLHCSELLVRITGRWQAQLHSLTPSQREGLSEEGRVWTEADQHICFPLSSLANEEKLLLPEKGGW